MKLVFSCACDLGSHARSSLAPVFTSLLLQTSAWNDAVLKGTQETELIEAMHAADLDGDGTINYEEFIVATVNLAKLEKVGPHCLHSCSGLCKCNGLAGCLAISCKPFWSRELCHVFYHSGTAPCSLLKRVPTA